MHKKRLCLFILFIVFLITVLMVVISNPSTKSPQLKLYDQCITTEQCRRSIAGSYCALKPDDDEHFRCYCDKGYFKSDDKISCTPYRKWQN